MKLDWTQPAIADLIRIDALLTENADRLVAGQQLDRIRQKARKLLQFPRRGTLMRPRLHRASVEKTSFVLLCRIERDSVRILRVRHNRENWRPE